mmetsp:Transcript_45680/g.145846  ORF Transcript_45680/g.145846 Transcript_45680/m.145846 type:complete len:377 (+) Transcript_45680:131-1261(+)
MAGRAAALVAAALLHAGAAQAVPNRGRSQWQVALDATAADLAPPQETEAPLQVNIAAPALINKQQRTIPANDTDNIYIFGYGSLMKEMSRIKTACNLSSVSESTLKFLENFAKINPTVEECIESVRSRTMILAKARGLKRGWYDRGKLQAGELRAQGVPVPESWPGQALDVAPTYLGAIEDKDSECYGVVYRVSKQELESTDARESAFGTVKPRWLDSKDLEVLSPGVQLPEGARVRWYAMSGELAAPPTAMFPICQSYVDIVLGGALELEEENGIKGFALNVVLTTHGWSNHWVNDRIVPYRPYVHESRAHQITRTLVAAAQLPHCELKMSQLKGITFPSMALSRQGLRSGSPAPAAGAAGLLGLALSLQLAMPG